MQRNLSRPFTVRSAPALPPFLPGITTIAGNRLRFSMTPIDNSETEDEEDEEEEAQEEEDEDEQEEEEEEEDDFIEQQRTPSPYRGDIPTVRDKAGPIRVGGNSNVMLPPPPAPSSRVQPPPGSVLPSPPSQATLLPVVDLPLPDSEINTGRPLSMVGVPPPPAASKLPPPLPPLRRSNTVIVPPAPGRPNPTPPTATVPPAPGRPDPTPTVPPAPGRPDPTPTVPPAPGRQSIIIERRRPGVPPAPTVPTTNPPVVPPAPTPTQFGFAVPPAPRRSQTGSTAGAAGAAGAAGVGYVPPLPPPPGPGTYWPPIGSQPTLTEKVQSPTRLQKSPQKHPIVGSVSGDPVTPSTPPAIIPNPELVPVGSQRRPQSPMVSPSRVPITISPVVSKGVFIPVVGGSSKIMSPARSPIRAKSPVTTPGETCCICMDTQVPSVKQTKCKHAICQACTKELRGMDCPACRAPLSGGYVTQDMKNTVQNKIKRDKEIAILTDAAFAKYWEVRGSHADEAEGRQLSDAFGAFLSELPDQDTPNVYVSNRIFQAFVEYYDIMVASKPSTTPQEIVSGFSLYGIIMIENPRLKLEDAMMSV
jgi:hypothetical protein